MTIDKEELKEIIKDCIKIPLYEDRKLVSRKFMGTQTEDGKYILGLLLEY